MSSNLHRIAYASLSTFKPFESNTGVDVNIAQILQIARQNNQKNRLVGALYYGSGCFFQCLEGKKQDIDALYAKLLKDPRHKDLKILVSESIETVGFSSWEMKFAAIDHEVRQLLRQHQLSKFDPFQFSAEMSHQLIGMLQRADEALTEKQVDQAVINVAKKQISYYTLASTASLIIAIVLGWYLMKQVNIGL
ncbi:MAG: BLUF domain-containing protein [Moraxellaceae bacterium]|nr:BLUF domain-containing protein [Moraxellaceae bacterium]